MNTNTTPYPVFGEVLRVWYLGPAEVNGIPNPNAGGLGPNGISRIDPSEGGHYITNGSERTVYDVALTFGDGTGTRIISQIGTNYPRPPAGFRIKAHPVGAPVQGIVLRGMIYLQFQEQFHPEGCN